MDVGEQYIRMCDCPEIQASHKIEDGDFYFRKLSSEKEGNWYISYTSTESDYTIEHPDQWDYLHAKVIWLPRQDQLQEMVIFENDRWMMICDFFAWCETQRMGNNLRDYFSMEQLWLAFVMKKKFNKVWEGEEWV